MTSTIGTNGRLGNQIIRNLAVSLLAEKHNLKVDYYNKQLIENLGIELFCGSNTYDKIEYLTDSNYFEIFNIDALRHNLNPNDNYFQSKEITTFLHNYLHKDEIKSNIIDKNPFKMRYNTNNDLFIHIRLTDVERYNPGIGYYKNAIANVSFDKLFISTDDEKHKMIIELLKLYPSSHLLHFDEINTLQFASTCKHVILSHGSFSVIIGHLSFFSNIYYPEYNLNRMWHGDMFSIDNWVKIKW